MCNTQYSLCLNQHNAYDAPQNIVVLDCTCNTQYSLCLNQHNADDAPQNIVVLDCMCNTQYSLLLNQHNADDAPQDNCSECNNTDTLNHRLTECGENENALGMDTEDHIARLLPTSPMNVPRGWLLLPYLCLWPPELPRSVLWLLSR